MSTTAVNLGPIFATPHLLGILLLSQPRRPLPGGRGARRAAQGRDARRAALRLREARLTTMFMEAANSRLRRPFGAAHHLWRAVPGQMAVFPAAVAHEVALNRSDEDLVLVDARARVRTELPLGEAAADYE